MSRLTEYQKPRPRYGLADAVWYPKTGWEIVDGAWQRWWALRGASFGLRLRRARVYRARGGWTWSVAERSPRGEWKEICKGAAGRVHFTAQGAWPFADLAARTGAPARRAAQRRTA